MCFLVASFIRKAKSNKNAEIIVLLQKKALGILVSLCCTVVRSYVLTRKWIKTQLYSLVCKALLALVKKLVEVCNFRGTVAWSYDRTTVQWKEIRRPCLFKIKIRTSRKSLAVDTCLLQQWENTSQCATNSDFLIFPNLWSNQKASPELTGKGKAEIFV